jgi:protein-S-isoprenylcysteine O-methyltransferase Ste14
VQWAGLAAAAVLFIAGARVYDHRSFLGLRQIQSGRDEELSLRRDGILSSVRHPYYGAGILFLLFWGDGDTANLIMRFVGIVYFLVGSEVEEGKLLRQFGETYDAYKRSTPRFFPSFRR